jgi:hypothetical protein
MNRKVILLNLVLLAVAGVCVWQLRLKQRDAATHQHAVLTQAPRPQPVAPPPPAPSVRTPTPVEYMDVAQRTLFAKDRNPNVVVQAPPPPPPPPPMPALPTYQGQMALAEPVIFLTLPGTEQKGYRPGDEVGPFKVVSFDREMVTFEWDGKTVERELSTLKPKELPPQAAQNAPPAAAPGAAPQGGAPAAGSGITSLAPTATTNLSKSDANKEPSLGTDMGGGFRGCAPGDTSPAGTVLSGYRKVLAQGLMGPTCHWEQIR